MTDDPSSSRALVLFSGGQDSATCLAWSLDRFDHVETVGFEYGQRHHIEMAARLEVRASMQDRFAPRSTKLGSRKLGSDHVLDLAALGEISDTAMTRDTAIAVGENGLPTTFVPGRNLMFLVMAAALAVRRGASVLVGGMCETDFSGYPDCRHDTLDTQMRAINLGMETALVLETPLMALTKGQSWALANDLGGDDLVDIIRTQTHTCYKGVRDVLHDWGYGCGECPACELRKKGWADYQSTRAGA